VAEKVSVSTSLSQLLVAFTIEVDGLFEALMPHSATVKAKAGIHTLGPWLVSQVMWSNYLRHIDEAGTTVGVLQGRARVSRSTITSRVGHLRRWSYLSVGDVKGTRYPDQIVILTSGGRRACEVFAPLPVLVEQRWSDRFGAEAVAELRAALEPIVDAAPPGLPDFLPVVDYGDGIRTEVVVPDGVDVRSSDGDDMSMQLSRALTRFTLEFEADSPVSLPQLQNALRVLDERSSSIQDIPLRAGVSRQAIDASIAFLFKAGLVALDGKGVKAVASITASGRAALTEGIRRLTGVETAWEREHGTAAVDRLRAAMDRILAEGQGPGSAMAEGLTPHDGGWRTYKPYRAQTDAVVGDPRAALPHHPMVLHRGGFPDGS
jgi:hypothetical protein